MSNINKNVIEQALTQAKGTAILGIDGMIDEIWELIDSRKGPTEYTKMTKMMDLGNAITERGTGGFAKERLLKRRSCGGFVCNTGRAVATFGLDTTFLGMFGQEPRDPLFDEFNGLAKLVSVGNPVYLHILEFLDGKIMMPHLDELINLKWGDIVEKLGLDTVKELFNKDIVGVGYWSNMHDFENILSHIVDICVENGRTKRIFHDFANLNKRTPEALIDGLKAMSELNTKLPQTLSLNEHEGGILANILGIDYPEDINNPASLEGAMKAVEEIRNKVNIDEVIIHTLYYAVIATANEGVHSSRQNYCENPVKTTGAGDTFNGGYMVSAITDLSPAERITVANITTLCFVSTGKPPALADFIKQMESFEI